MNILAKLKPPQTKVFLHKAGYKFIESASIEDLSRVALVRRAKTLISRGIQKRMTSVSQNSHQSKGGANPIPQIKENSHEGESKIVNSYSNILCFNKYKIGAERQLSNPSSRNNCGTRRKT
jgi:hypothetical protein